MNLFRRSPQKSKLGVQAKLSGNPLQIEKSHLSSPTKNHTRLRASELSGLKTVNKHSSIVNVAQFSSGLKPSKETLRASFEEMDFVIEDKADGPAHLTSNMMSKHTT